MTERTQTNIMMLQTSGSTLANQQNSLLSNTAISFTHSRRFPTLFSYPHNLPLTLPSTLSPRNTSMGFGRKFTDGCIPNILRNAKEKPAPCEYFDQLLQKLKNGKSFGISREQKNKQFVHDNLLPQVGLSEQTIPGPGTYLQTEFDNSQFHWTLTPRRKLFNSDLWIAGKNSCYTPKYVLSQSTKYTECPIKFKQAPRVNNILFRKNENPGPGSYDFPQKIGKKKVEEKMLKEAIVNRRNMIGNGIAEANKKKYATTISLTPRYKNAIFRDQNKVI